MAQTPNPQEVWNRLQRQLRSSNFGGGGGGGQPPRSFLTGIGGFVLLAGGVWAFNNALFNGADEMLRNCS